MPKTIKAIGIAGSPRKDGNSTALLAAALTGAEQAGAKTQTIYLNDLTYRGCQACGPCTADATCRITDELTPVLEAVRQADVWVLASPVYFDGVSGQMKTFFDRCYHLIKSGRESRKQLPGRRAAAVIVTHGATPPEDYRIVAGRLAKYLQWMGDFGKVETMAAGIGPDDRAANHADLLEKARAIGRKLVERLGIDEQ